MLSTVATTSIEDAIAARGRPVWFQLYPTDNWEVAEALARRAEKAGAGAIVVTVDVLARQNWETLYRLMRDDTRDCSACHQRTMQSFVQRKPNFDGIDLAGLNTTGHTTLTWEFVKRLRDTVKTRLLVKGLMTAEDADARRRQRSRRHRRVEPWRARRRQRPLDHRRPAGDPRSGAAAACR